MYQCLMKIALLFVLSFCSVLAAVEDKKIYRVGSSSFPYAIIQQLRAVVEAGGAYRLVCDEKKDQAGYTRLDELARKPAMYKEWMDTNIPKIAAGKYDFVVFQTISWLTLKPDQQAYLVQEMLPEMTRKIREAGAEVVLYDKYLPLQNKQKKESARTWCLRYPHGQELNYLLHIWAARASGIERITFGGQVVKELEFVSPFAEIGPVFWEVGTGPMGNYITAINMAAALTGSEPMDDPLRVLPCPEWAIKELKGTPYASRLGKGTIRMIDAEAKALAEAALVNYRYWNKRMDQVLLDEDAFVALKQRVAEIQSDMGAYEKYGLDPKTAEKFAAQFEEAENEGDLPPSVERKIRKQGQNIVYTDTSVRKALARHFEKKKAKGFDKEFKSYWNEHNAKLRDDIYIRANLMVEKLERSGDLSEAKRIARSANMLRLIISLPAYRMMAEALPQNEVGTFLEQCGITSSWGNLAPRFKNFHNSNLGDPKRLFQGWEMFLDIWTDPELMDETTVSAKPSRSQIMFAQG